MTQINLKASDSNNTDGGVFDGIKTIFKLIIGIPCLAVMYAGIALQYVWAAFCVCITLLVGCWIFQRLSWLLVLIF